MTNAEYEQNEAMLLMKRLREVEQPPLKDRQDAAAEFLKDLSDPVLIAERIDWLLVGNYGYGEMQQAKRVVASRGNRAMHLTVLIAALEWQCPSRMAIAAWKKLTPPQQEALDKAVQKVIKKYTPKPKKKPKKKGKASNKGAMSKRS